MALKYGVDELTDDVNRPLTISNERTCECSPKHINCLTAKEWLKNQLGVWQFNYETRDIRDKTLHPATFPISLALRIIEQFTHQGELVLDPFVGSGTALLAAQDVNRNAVGFDLSCEYVKLSLERISQQRLIHPSVQLAVNDDARNIPRYLPEESVSLVVTSPPYANLLNRKTQETSLGGTETTDNLAKSSSTLRTRETWGRWTLTRTLRTWEPSLNLCCLYSAGKRIV